MKFLLKFVIVFVLFSLFIKAFSQTGEPQGNDKEIPIPVFRPDKKDFPELDSEFPLGIP